MSEGKGVGWVWPRTNGGGWRPTEEERRAAEAFDVKGELARAKAARAAAAAEKERQAIEEELAAGRAKPEDFRL